MTNNSKHILPSRTGSLPHGQASLHDQKSLIPWVQKRSSPSRSWPKCERTTLYSFRTRFKQGLKNILETAFNSKRSSQSTSQHWATGRTHGLPIINVSQPLSCRFSNSTCFVTNGILPTRETESTHQWLQIYISNVVSGRNSKATHTTAAICTFFTLSSLPTIHRHPHAMWLFQISWR